MNFRKRMMSAALAVIMMCSLCVSSVLAEDTKTNETSEGVQILFTHDLHSRLDEFKSGEEMIGGVARLKTAIDEKRAENEATFVLDGGDFSMGTLFQTIFQTQAAELTMLGRLGYDATTFGNHEFDYRPAGVVSMFESAMRNAEEDDSLVLPQFLIANIDWELNNDEEDQAIQQVLEEYGSTAYTLIERNGINVGIFGVVGQDAEDCAPESGIDFDSIIDSSKVVVEQLKEEGAELIVCLSHSGTWENEEDSEDEQLAKAVPEIDVIISGHTHTELPEPIIHGDTIIASAGDYGRYLGEIDLIPNENGRWTLANYQLNPMDESVEKDDAITAEVESYKKDIDSEYLSMFGYKANQVIAKNDIPFTQMSDFGKELEEDTLGNLIADSYVYAVKEAEGEDYEPIALAVTANGVVRDTFQTGDITVSDAFNVSALGIGADGVVGYPLVSVWLTGAELKVAAEIDASVSSLMSAAQLYPSGMKWVYNPNRLILNRVTEVGLTGDTLEHTDVYYQDKMEEIEDDKLYRVIAGLYSAQMLGAVEDKSYGILSVTPKDKEGNVITDFEEHIIHDQDGNEVKEWYALASYIDSFEENEEGISVIPARYSESEGRKVEEDSLNPFKLLKNPNKIALVVYAIVIVLVLLIVLIVRVCYTKIQRKRKRRRK